MRSRSYPPSDDTLGIGVALLLMGLCVVAFAITRSNAVRRTFATSKLLTDTDLDLMMRVAWIQRRRAAFFVAACCVAPTLLGALPLVPLAQLFILGTMSALLAVGVVALARYQLLLGLRPEPGLRVRMHGQFLFVERDQRLVGWATVPLAAVSRLPVAKLRT